MVTSKAPLSSSSRGPDASDFCLQSVITDSTCDKHLYVNYSESGCRQRALRSSMRPSSSQGLSSCPCRRQQTTLCTEWMTALSSLTNHQCYTESWCKHAHPQRGKQTWWCLEEGRIMSWVNSRAPLKVLGQPSLPAPSLGSPTSPLLAAWSLSDVHLLLLVHLIQSAFPAPRGSYLPPHLLSRMFIRVQICTGIIMCLPEYEQFVSPKHKDASLSVHVQ